MDLLSTVLSHFSFNANVFFSGNLCGIKTFEKNAAKVGHLHLLRSGCLKVKDEKGTQVILDKPAVLYFPRATQHRLFADETTGADLVCAEVDYNDAANSPLLNSLPDYVFYELEDAGLLGQSAFWLFDEAFSQRSGREPIIDRLCDIFLINIIRKIVETGEVAEGMIAGLAHPQLSVLLALLHQHPEKSWSVSLMAETCLMSRSKFAAVFREVIGQTPLDYLTDWRMAMTKNLLLKKQNIDLIAQQVGYENGSALARAFRKKNQLSPRQWLNLN